MNIENLDNNYKEELDLNYLYKIIIRNKKLILITTIAGFLFGCFISIIPKRTWQGEFQIVIDTNSEENASMGLNPNLARLGGFDVPNNDLMTEVEILKSPSVLMDIFEFVKKKKTLDNKRFKNFKFKTWKEQFSINLERGTQVLNLSYRDKDKDFIIPTLNKISKTYQSYKNTSKRKVIKTSKKYFEDQISIYQAKSDNSIKDFWEYGIEQGMSTKLIPSSEATINEAPKIQTLNRISYLKEQLNRMKKIDNDSEQIIKTAYTLPNSLTSSKTIVQINSIDKELAELKTKYRKNDLAIINTENKRKILLNLLKTEVTDFLASEIEKEEIKLKSIDRPKDILIKYDSLKRIAQKDKLTLSNLESEYRDLLLKEAKSEEPWQLITKPTLLPYPVAPERKKIALLNLLIGALLGSLLAILKDKKEDKLFSSKNFEQLFKTQVLAEISLGKDTDFEEKIALLEKSLNLYNKESTAFLKVGNFGSLQFNEKFKKINSSLDSKQTIFTNKLSEALNSSNIFLMVVLGISTKKEIYNINNYLKNFKNNSIKGTIILRNSASQ